MTTTTRDGNVRYVIDIDTTGDFLDYPPLLYRDSDGTLHPPFREEELPRLGQIWTERVDDPSEGLVVTVYFGTERGGLIRVIPGDNYYLDSDGEWIADPPLRFLLYGDPDDPLPRLGIEDGIERVER
jgi:hypothetical protein